MATPDRYAVSERIEDGHEQGVRRRQSVSFHEAFPDEDPDGPAARVWALTCGARKMPGRVWDATGRALGGGARPADAITLGWWWATKDAHDRAALCGTKTLETVVKGDNGQTWVIHHRMRCKSARCLHCGPRIVGVRHRRRMEVQAAVDRAACQPWVMLTFTLDPAKWTAEHELDTVPSQAAAVAAQRWAGRGSRRLLRALRDTMGGEYLRVIEPHRSGWPHVHVLVRGGRWASAIMADAQDKGRVEDDDDPWSAVARFAERERIEHRQKRRRVARCPCPRVRRWVSQVAVSQGWGVRCDVSPVRWSSMERVAGYVTKGPVSQGHGAVLADPGHMPSEVTKTSNRDKLLAPGVRAWAASQKWYTVDHQDRAPKDGRVIDVRIIPRTLEALRASMPRPRSTAVVVDFMGPIPDRGRRRPAITETMVYETAVSWVDRLHAHRRDRLTWAAYLRVEQDKPPPVDWHAEAITLPDPGRGPAPATGPPR